MLLFAAQEFLYHAYLPSTPSSWYECTSTAVECFTGGAALLSSGVRITAYEVYVYLDALKLKLKTHRTSKYSRYEYSMYKTAILVQFFRRQDFSCWSVFHSFFTFVVYLYPTSLAAPVCLPGTNNCNRSTLLYSVVPACITADKAVYSCTTQVYSGRAALFASNFYAYFVLRSSFQALTSMQGSMCMWRLRRNRSGWCPTGCNFVPGIIILVLIIPVRVHPWYLRIAAVAYRRSI